ncbi:MAG: DUF4838 domain-containing protein [Hyphomicrobiaceae bacterium]
MISLGANQASQAAGLSISDVPIEGFRIKVVDHNIFLLGADTPDGMRTAEGGVSTGTLNAVYTFLEDYLGVRWLMPGEVGEYVPRVDTVKLPSRLSRLEGPSFANRRIAYIENRNPLVVQWLRRQKQGHSLILNHSHAWHDLIPPSLYRDHPEWFAMIDGKRVAPSGDRYKLETTNEKLVRTVAAKVIAEFRKQPTLFTASISPTDSGHWSASPESLALYDVDPLGRQSVTPLILSFYSAVAREVAQVLPDKKVCGYIYDAYLYPPSTGVPPLPSNLCLVVAPSFSYGYGLYKPDLRAEWERLIAAWHSPRQVRAYYDLPTIFFPDVGGPQPLGLDILSFIYPRLAAAGYRGIYIYGASGWGHGAATNYILAKLNWNADADPKALADEFFRLAYGPAAGDAVGKLYALVDKAAKVYYERGGRQGEVPSSDLLKNVYLPTLSAMTSQMHQALGASTGPSERLRLEMLRMGFAELYRLLRRHQLIDESAIPDEISQPSEVATSNAEPVSGFELALRARVAPDADKIHVMSTQDITGRAAKAADGLMLLRGAAKAVLLPGRNGRIEVRISKLVNAGEDLDYLLYTTDKRIISRGRLDRDGIIAFDGNVGQLVLLKIEAESAWFHMDVKGARFALSTAEQRRGLHFIGIYPTVYFHVPANLDHFRVTISNASTEEWAAADLIDAEERVVASLDTSGRLVAQTLASSGAKDGFWRLQWKRPWMPHKHNVWIQLDERLAPWVVVSPEQALAIGAAH